MTGVFINKETLDIKTETYTGRSPHEDDDRDQDDAVYKPKYTKDYQQTTTS